MARYIKIFASFSNYLLGAIFPFIYSYVLYAALLLESSSRGAAATEIYQFGQTLNLQGL